MPLATPAVLPLPPGGSSGADDPCGAPLPAIWTLGLMSGTSMDGIDAALVRTDGRRVLETGPSLTLPYPCEFRAGLRACLGRRDADAEVAAVAERLTDLHAEAVAALLERAGMAREAVGVVGFHGHTVLHLPAERRTWQIGNPQRLADRTGLAVVADLRLADIAAGGEGAPLAPIYHAALAGTLEPPLAVLNIGGVANVTLIPDVPAGGSGAPALLAFDTGPGNALLDDWVQARTGRGFDQDGALARAGRADAGVIAGWLRHPYFARRPPKSLDRDDFRLSALAADLAGLSTEDGAATLAAFTVAAIEAGTRFLAPMPRRWLVTGGGRRNPALMRALGEALGVPVQAVEAVGWDGDALEAQAFGFLAARHLAGLPISFPGTTRAPRPLAGGRLYRPA